MGITADRYSGDIVVEYLVNLDGSVKSALPIRRKFEIKATSKTFQVDTYMSLGHVSYVVYGTFKYWWVIHLLNAYPEELLGVDEGDKVKLPSLMNSRKVE